jgi:hypothetical protein
MSGASSKARLALEYGAPELQEFVRQEIFTKVCIYPALIAAPN